MRRLAGVIATAYVVGGALLVFSPISRQLFVLTERLHVLWVYQLHLPGDLSAGAIGALLNLLLFVPLGVLVVLLVRWPWWLVTLAAMTISAGIELIQAVPMLHRQTSLGDVITNTTGGLIGALIGARIRAIAASSGSAGRAMREDA